MDKGTQLPCTLVRAEKQLKHLQNYISLKWIELSWNIVVLLQ